MPLLNQTDFDNLKARKTTSCTCQGKIRMNYCRACDEFYFIGHYPNCPHADQEHIGHRTYDLDKKTEREARINNESR